MMNTICKIGLTSILFLGTFAGCSNTQSAQSTTSSSQEEVLELNMADYPEFEEATVLDLQNAMSQNESMIVYFGFSTCPWCYYAVPVLHEVVTDNNMSVMYINTRANSEWESNLDIDNYDVVVELLGDYLDYDNDGIKHLYTPHVFFIKDGSVVLDHEGTVDEHDAHERPITDEETARLKEIYETGIELMK